MKAQRTFEEAESFDFSAARDLVKRCIVLGFVKLPVAVPEIPDVAIVRKNKKRATVKRRVS